MNQVRLESQHEEQYPASPLSPLLHREAKEAANGWLARFSPLLDPSTELGAEDCRGRLEQVPELRAEGEAALKRLEAQATQADRTLLLTVRDALRELEHLENEMRRRLGLLAPGDPAGAVDLTDLRERLAEAAARRELEETTGSSLATPGHLEVKVSPGSLPGALFMGIFSLGWLSFTTLHADFMIGGMMQAFGPLALAMLLFYAIFWAVGIGMGYAAIMAGSQENLTLDGRELTLHRRFLSWTWEKKHTLGKESRAYVTEAAVRQNGSAAKEVLIQDQEGRDIRLAHGRPAFEQERLVAHINEHLVGVGH
jgi:hypothetical protein